MIKPTCWIAIMASALIMFCTCNDGSSNPNPSKPANQLLAKTTKWLTCEGTKIAMLSKQSTQKQFIKLSETYNDGYLDYRENRACYGIA